jgi:hypothetical protein
VIDVRFAPKSNLTIIEGGSLPPPPPDQRDRN